LLVVSVFLFTSCFGNRASAASVPAATADGFVRAHRLVSTRSVTAQAAFDDGLTLLYAFNPEQARVSFRSALEADPSLAIAWWGVAMSYGTNLNVSFDGAAQRHGRDAVVKARALATRASPVERALIEAAVARFVYDRDADADRSARAYRDAMYAAASDYPNDDDVQTLAAEAEMNVHPWSFFDPNGTPTAGTPGIISRLQTVLARDPEHIGANHYLIHALEESPHPEGALAAAQRLAADRVEPAAEHLIHMPAHDFMRVGMYHEAGVANARAIDAYHTYLASDPAGHADYFGHDCVFGVDAFMMSGEYARARALAASCNGGRGGLLAIVDLRFAHYDALASDEHAGAPSRRVCSPYTTDASTSQRRDSPRCAEIATTWASSPRTFSKPQSQRAAAIEVPKSRLFRGPPTCRTAKATPNRRNSGCRCSSRSARRNSAPAITRRPSDLSAARWRATATTLARCSASRERSNERAEPRTPAPPTSVTRSHGGRQTANSI